MGRSSDFDLKAALAELVGRDLTSVEFVLDYIQLHFEKPCLTALNLPSVRGSGWEVKFGEHGYRDRLCEQIGARVEAVDANEVEAILRFADGNAIVISLRDEDYRGPEAINFTNGDGTWWVV
jgi:hypothetical protein